MEGRAAKVRNGRAEVRREPWLVLTRAVGARLDGASVRPQGRRARGTRHGGGGEYCGGRVRAQAGRERERWLIGSCIDGDGR